MWGMKCEGTLLTKTPTAFHTRAQGRFSAPWVEESPSPRICGTPSGFHNQGGQVADPECAARLRALL